ncbi:hypothetical protein Taro_037268 [Colocasia esculenta]|uniref:Uncharacterized protein n=1 Tax=Colocasia esculenta TaxID=4460 RepID=A0A843WFS3_COLES|nr:hypothetical protein [Colocasia esculenta]
MQGLVQAMQTQAHTQAALQAQLEAQQAQVFKGQSKVRLLPLGRLRSRKTKNPSLHPLKKKATTAVSRSRRRRCLRRVHVKASRRLLCRVIRYTFLFILPFQEGDNKGVAIRVVTRCRSQSENDSSSVAIRYALYPYTFFRYLKSAEVWEERDEGCVAFKEATGALSRSEHSLEGLRKSPLTVDSHTVAKLVVPIAT